MDDSFNLARHVARFMSLLMRQPDAVDQQKLELRTLALLTKDGTVRLTVRAGQLIANGLAVPQVLAGVHDLAERMAGHDIESIEVNQGMSPGELLAIGRIVAEPVTMERLGIHERIRAVATTTITVTLRELTPDASGDGVAQAPAEPEPPVGSPERIPFLLSRAARGGDGAPLVTHFEEVVFAIEQATREGRTAAAMSVFCEIIEHEKIATDQEVRRQFLLAIRRLVKPTILHPIARIIADDADRAGDAITILRRCGPDGADAAIDQFARAATAAERGRLREALNQLPATDVALVAMLGDGRPHVARHAANLIGERRPLEGDNALADYLSDDVDQRVRRAAVRALGNYETPFAIDAIARALTDPVVEVRLEAVAVLGRRKAPRAIEIISRAIGDEPEVDVQIGMIGALGRVGTSEAVAMLAKVAEPASSIFGSRKGPGVRVAAVRALAEARTAAAMSALLALVNDKEREVRDTAARAVAR